MTFEVEATDGHARAGVLTLPRGTAVETPVFMPVGTRGSVKGVTPEQLEAIGVRLLLGNTYHLGLRPGPEVVAALGGLHGFMGWRRGILTDSGGFQVFSLADLNTVTDEGVRFRSHIDGSELHLTPKESMRIQEALGSDIAMVLDVCPPHPCSQAEAVTAVERTTRWAEVCRRVHRRDDQLLFGIVQGGVDLELRARSLAELVPFGFDGYAVGGLSVGEGPELMRRVLAAVAPELPADRPRYLMGVGPPLDVLQAVEAGIDMFDCVMPTRNARNATVFTFAGRLRLRNACHRQDPRPIAADCPCYACRNFSRAYVHHLFRTKEMLGPTLATLHNLTFYHRFMQRLRQAIRGRRLAAEAASLRARLVG